MWCFFDSTGRKIQQKLPKFCGRAAKSFHRLNAECVWRRERARGDWETDEARARTRGASCYGGTEHVADKRAPLFKERGAAVKCAPIRHHRLILSLNEPGEGSLGVRRIRRCLAPITPPGLFYSNLTHKLSHSQSGRRCLSHSGRMLTRQMNE